MLKKTTRDTILKVLKCSGLPESKIIKELDKIDLMTEEERNIYFSKKDKIN